MAECKKAVNVLLLKLQLGLFVIYFLLHYSSDRVVLIGTHTDRQTDTHTHTHIYIFILLGERLP